VCGSELLAELGDVAAELLVALVSGFQAADQGQRGGALSGGYRCCGGSAVQVAELLDGRADVGLGVEPGAADGGGRGDLGVGDRLAGGFGLAQSAACAVAGLLVASPRGLGSRLVVMKTGQGRHLLE
jgi:hypothetical protein